jgi:hypothetical protein
MPRQGVNVSPGLVISFLPSPLLGNNRDYTLMTLSVALWHSRSRDFPVSWAEESQPGSNRPQRALAEHTTTTTSTALLQSSWLVRYKYQHHHASRTLTGLITHGPARYTPLVFLRAPTDPVINASITPQPPSNSRLSTRTLDQRKHGFGSRSELKVQLAAVPADGNLPIMGRE